MPSAHFKMKTANSIPTKVTPNVIWQNLSLKALKYLKMSIWWKTFLVYWLA